MKEQEALTFTYKDYENGMEQIVHDAANCGAYLDGFTVSFPDGINNAAAYEICRALKDSSFEAKIRLTRICIVDKKVEITCPNGDFEQFQMADIEDSFDAFPIFEKEPLALIALTDCVYGYVAKKSFRLSKPQKAGQVTALKA
ncbi:MAG: hypothetical protein ACTTGZ_05990 [Treponema sp.]